MKLFHFGKDGGSESTVWGFWLIEWKALFSVAFLIFENGTRDVYHNHAFNSCSWVLWGQLEESLLHQPEVRNTYKPSLDPVFTWRGTFHQVRSVGRSIVLTLRGPWVRTWKEWNGSITDLTHGRKVANAIK